MCVAPNDHPPLPTLAHPSYIGRRKRGAILMHTQHTAHKLPVQQVHNMDLVDAKALAKRIDDAAKAPEARVTGTAMGIDVYSHVGSAQACQRFVDAGLQTATHFTKTQPNHFQCGHNTAGWSCLLRALGENFMQLSAEAIEAINNLEYARAMNTILGYAAGD